MNQSGISPSVQFTSNPLRKVIPALLAAVVLVGAAPVRAEQSGKVYPPNSVKYGNDYSGWSAKWWQWTLELPLAGHPSVDSPDFDVTTGQSGDVWFLSGPFGQVTREVTIPTDKALFIGIATVECSSLEPEESGFHGDTAKEQRTLARYWADHIEDVFCVIDGEAVRRPEAYRVTSPQYDFLAPSPWLFGEVGGAGTSVGDGYYVFLSPLAPGEHTIHFGGVFRFTLEEDGFDAELPIDMTYHVTVE